MHEKLTNRIPISWATRSDSPLKPEIVVASGKLACHLLTKCLDFNEQRLAHIEGLSCADLVLLKSDEDLPWIKGVSFLGRDALAPNIYIPTHLTANVPLPLLEKALLKKTGVGPIAVLPVFHQLLPLDKLLNLDRQTINVWLGEYC